MMTEQKKWVAIAKCFIGGRLYEPCETFDYAGPQGKAFKLAVETIEPRLAVFPRGIHEFSREVSRLEARVAQLSAAIANPPETLTEAGLAKVRGQLRDAESQLDQLQHAAAK